MVKADVVRRVRLETGISQGEAEDLINELLEIMRQTLESGDNLMVTNFGLFELKDKVGVVEAWGHASGGEATQESVFNDGLLALINLGYKQTEANKAITQLRKSGEFSGDSTVDEIIRAGLRILN